MRSFTLIPLLAGLANALPQASGCITVTSEIIIPTTTVTFTTTHVTTIFAASARNLGTFTVVTTESSTKTLATVTSTQTDCAVSGRFNASTVYTVAGASTIISGPAAYFKLQAAACTVTATITTSVGQTETFVAAPGKTSTFTEFTDFSQETATSTKFGGTAYAIATAVAPTNVAICGATVTQDARCAPSALISESNGYGLEYADDVPIDGAAYSATTDDASQCCQLCAEMDTCAASSWDIRTSACKLEFPVNSTTGDLNCGEGLLAYYDAGPLNPMDPGTGLFVAALCGNVEFGSAAPDDGT